MKPKTFPEDLPESEVISQMIRESALLSTDKKKPTLVSKGNPKEEKKLESLENIKDGMSEECSNNTFLSDSFKIAEDANNNDITFTNSFNESFEQNENQENLDTSVLEKSVLNLEENTTKIAKLLQKLFELSPTKEEEQKLSKRFNYTSKGSDSNESSEDEKTSEDPLVWKQIKDTDIKTLIQLLKINNFQAQKTHEKFKDMIDKRMNSIKPKIQKLKQSISKMNDAENFHYKIYADEYKTLKEERSEVKNNLTTLKNLILKKLDNLKNQFPDSSMKKSKLYLSICEYISSKISLDSFLAVLQEEKSHVKMLRSSILRKYLQQKGTGAKQNKKIQKVYKTIQEFFKSIQEAGENPDGIIQNIIGDITTMK